MFLSIFWSFFDKFVTCVLEAYTFQESNIKSPTVHQTDVRISVNFVTLFLANLFAYLSNQYECLSNDLKFIGTEIRYKTRQKIQCA